MRISKGPSSQNDLQSDRHRHLFALSRMLGNRKGFPHFDSNSWMLLRYIFGHNFTTIMLWQKNSLLHSSTGEKPRCFWSSVFRPQWKHWESYTKIHQLAEKSSQDYHKPFVVRCEVHSSSGTSGTALWTPVLFESTQVLVPGPVAGMTRPNLQEAHAAPFQQEVPVIARLGWRISTHGTDSGLLKIAKCCMPCFARSNESLSQCKPYNTIVQKGRVKHVMPIPRECNFRYVTIQIRGPRLLNSSPQKRTKTKQRCVPTSPINPAMLHRN